MVFTIRALIEVLGFPEEHIKEIVKKVLEKLEKEDGIEIINKEIHETQTVKETFFSCFTELELKIHDLSILLKFCYDYLPSNIEILDADNITIPSREFNLSINEMLERLHQYNIIVNNLSNQVKKLEKPQ